MKWLQLDCEVKGEDTDRLIELLEMLGSQASTQKNAGEDSYYDLAHPAEPKWDIQTVSGLFEIDESNAAGYARELVSQLSEQLDKDAKNPLVLLKPIKQTTLAETDWEKAWLKQYRPTQITPKLWVYPSWEALPKDVASLGTVIKIDPGLAFGTGTHETTRLCMQALGQLALNGAHVLDYGCGSGILGITAIKLGALRATGVDIDPKAEQVSKENAVKNGVDSSFTIQSAQDCANQSYAVVIANILASALIELAPKLSKLTQSGGHILLSGVLKHQAESVKLAYQDQFDFGHDNALIQEGDWIALLGVKKP